MSCRLQPVSTANNILIQAPRVSHWPCLSEDGPRVCSGIPSPPGSPPDGGTTNLPKTYRSNTKLFNTFHMFGAGKALFFQKSSMKCFTSIRLHVVSRGYPWACQPAGCHGCSGTSRWKCVSPSIGSMGTAASSALELSIWLVIVRSTSTITLSHASCEQTWLLYMAVTSFKE